MLSTIISVRIRKEVKEELERSGINISEVVKSHLEELAWKIKIRRKLKEWDMILSRVKPSKKGFSTESVRNDRESH
ncbi:MAG: VapB-type antitoxin [Thermoproteales archaeon]|nr:VapB-type antitoxin [Thermoproteales archaeon]